MNLTKKITYVLIAMMSAIDVSTSLADDNAKNPFGPWYLTDRESGWYFDVFAGVENEPAYAGSDKYEIEPGFNIRTMYKNSNDHRFFVSLGELGGIFQLTENSVFSAVLEYEEGRSNSADSALKGFDKVRDTVEGQFSFFYRFLPNTFLAAVIQPDLLGRGKGLVYFVGLGNDTLFFSDTLRVSTGIDLSFADAEHMRTEFGVSDSESRRSGLEAYRPHGGIKSWTGSLVIEYFAFQNWSVWFDSELEYYTVKARRSPLIRDEGRPFTYELAAGLRWRY